ncbi:hypothetical protein WDW37_05670 [Bdellovibrionota bacterium FG-1]
MTFTNTCYRPYCLAFVVVTGLLNALTAPAQTEMQGIRVLFPTQVPSPADNPLTPEKVALGHKLFLRSVFLLINRFHVIIVMM